jgi:hypothetical protein
MKKPSRGVLAFVLLLCFAPAFCAVKNKGPHINYPVKINDKLYKIYKVYENGETKTLMQLSTGSAEESSSGSTLPKISSDEKHMAYCDDNILWIAEISGVKKQKIAPKNGMGKALVNGWSRDGTRLLYHIVEDVGDNDDESLQKKSADNGDNSSVPPSVTDEGYFVYDLSSKKSERVDIKGAYISWGKDGNIICQWPNDYNSREIISIDLKGNTSTLFKCNGWGINEIGQIFIGQTGMASAMAGASGSNEGVILIDLAGHSSTDITGKEDWSRIQWPEISPSGKKVSWIDSGRRGKDTGYIHDIFVVDKKTIFKTQDLIDEYEWISDSAIAVITRSDEDVNSVDELYVINADSGKIINMTPLK